MNFRACIVGTIVNNPTFRYNFDGVKKYQMGEFEEIRILAIGVLNNEVYSAAIKDEIESRRARNVNMGALAHLAQATGRQGLPEVVRR